MTARDIKPENVPTFVQRIADGLTKAFAPTEQPDTRRADMTDYTKMNGAEVLSAMGDDARKWAASFMQHLAASPTKEVNEDLMQSWFANAIVRGQDELRWRQERQAADVAPKRREAVFQALGEASMCWDQIDKAGTFESTRAEGIGNRLLAALEALNR